MLEQTQPGVKKEYRSAVLAIIPPNFCATKTGNVQRSRQLKNQEYRTCEKENINAINSYVTLQPLERWHLYCNYVNGKETQGFMEYVKIFTIVGILVFLLRVLILLT